MSRCKELEDELEALENDLEDAQLDRDNYLMELSKIKAKTN